MGVDYSANYGVGIKINTENNESLGDGNGEISDYLENLPEPKSELKLSFFRVGSGSYTGEIDDFYLCFKYSLKEGVDVLGNKMQLFEAYLNENGVPTEGNIDIVGGLCIW